MKKSERPLLIKCPHCGKQNLIAPERLKLIKDVSLKCWACQKEIPYDFIMGFKERD